MELKRLHSFIVDDLLYDSQTVKSIGGHDCLVVRTLHWWPTWTFRLFSLNRMGYVTALKQQDHY